MTDLQLNDFDRARAQTCWDEIKFSNIRTEQRSAARGLFTALGIPSVWCQTWGTGDFQNILADPKAYFVEAFTRAADRAPSAEELKTIASRFYEVSKHDAEEFKNRRAKAWLGYYDLLTTGGEAEADTKEATTPKAATPDNREATPEPKQTGLGAAVAVAVSAAIEGVLAELGDASIDREEVRAIVSEELRQYAKPSTIRIITPKGERESTALRHCQFETLLKMVGAGVNVCLTGPAGSGKTTAAKQAADALGLPFEFTGAINSEYKLSGFIDAQGRVVSTSFRKAYTQGGLFLFDEVDGSNPNAILAFNAALANDWCDFPDKREDRHPDFRCVAGANTFWSGQDREYVGRFQMDAAFKDRFEFLSWDYDEGLERSLASNQDWVKRVQALRNAARKLKIRHVISPRATINGGRLLEAGISKRIVEDVTIWKGLDNDARRKIEQEAA